MEDEPETVVSIEAASQEVNESCSEIQVYDYRVTRFFKEKVHKQGRSEQVVTATCNSLWIYDGNILKKLYCVKEDE